jgi:biotin carboxyl carrier protein
VIAALDSLSISIDGKIVDLTTEGTPPDLGVVANGHRAYVNVESERQRAAAQAKRGSRGPGDKVALAPMPGRIIRVRVQAGDTITQGQPLVVMEAMKMENEIRAKTAGIVASVHVATGDTVESGAQLVKFS